MKTQVYGDVNNFGTRVQAGTSSATGGIQDGDAIPAGAMVAARSAPPQAAAFPWRMWEGALTDGDDVLVITPSLWEQDGGTAFHTQWEQRQASLTATLFTSKHVQDQITQESFGSILLRMMQSSQDMMRSINSYMNGITQPGVDLSKGSDNVLFTNFQMTVGNLLAANGDRPIGLIPNGTSGTMLADHTVVLTREIIEKALARPASGPIPSPVPGGPGMSGVGSIATKPGIIVLDLQDGVIPGFLGFPQRPAKYQLFIQVERMP